MASYRVGSSVVFSFGGSTKIGKVEGVKISRRVRVYQVRAEDGKLYADIKTDSKNAPGSIKSKLTESFFKNKGLDEGTDMDPDQ